MSNFSRREFLKKSLAGGTAITLMGSTSKVTVLSSSHLPEVDWQAPEPMVERVVSDEWVPPKGTEEVAAALERPLKVYNMGDLKFDPATVKNAEIFGERTGIEVEHIPVSAPVALAKETTVLSSRSPEPVMMHVGSEYYLNFVEPGWLEPTCEIWDEPTLKHFPPAYKQDLMTDIDATRDVNCIYGASYYSGLQMVHWRTDVLKEVGLNPEDYHRPTWDDILEIGEALEGTNRFACSINGLPLRNAAHWLVQEIFAQGGNIWQDGKLIFNSPEGVAAIEFLQELVEKRYVPNPATTNETDVSTGFLAGKSVSALHGTNIIAQAKDEIGLENYNLTTSFTPNTGSNPNPASLLATMMICINTWSPEIKKLAAKIYCDFRRSRESLVREFATETNTPAIDVALDDPVNAEGPYADYIPTIKAGLDNAIAGLYPRLSSIGDKIGKELGSVYSGDASAKEALDNAQEFVDATLGQ